MKATVVSVLSALVAITMVAPASSQVDKGSPPVTVITIPGLELAPPPDNGGTTSPSPQPSPPSEAPPTSAKPAPPAFERSAVPNGVESSTGFGIEDAAGMVAGLIAIVLLVIIAKWYRRASRRRDAGFQAVHQSREPSPTGRDSFDVLTAIFAGPDDVEVVVRLTARFNSYELAAQKARSLRSESKTSDTLRQTCWIVISEASGHIELVVESDEGPESWLVGSRLDAILTGSESWKIDGVHAVYPGGST